MNFHELSPEKQQVFLNGVAILEKDGVDAVKTWLATDYEFDFAKSEDAAKAETYIQAFINYVAERETSNGALGASALAAAEPYAEPEPLAELIAAKFVGFGGHVIFFARGTKRCTEVGWQQSATNDLVTAVERARKNPYANVGLVGKQNGLWALDIDDPTVAAEITQLEQQYDPIGTYRTRTVSGGQHLIFRQNAASWAMGNVSVTDESKAELLSARVDDRYVVLAGSWAHPHNDESLPLAQYTAVDPDASVIEAPQWLLDYIKAKVAQSQTDKGRTATQPAAVTTVGAGGRNNYLASVAGKMRQSFGWGYAKIKQELLVENENKCVPPLPEFEVDSIAKSISGYEQKPGEIICNTSPDAPVSTNVAQTAVQQPPEIDTSEGYTRPEFPQWAIQGTSIWNGLVEPALKTSSKHAEFIAMPSIQMMLNFLSGQVRVGLTSTNLNIYLGLISPYGEFFKSSSCALAMDYFRVMGTLFAAGRKNEIAGERTAIIQAGSPEGFGLEAKQRNARRAILFNDELSKFVSKAGIEGSSFSSDLLTWYGSGEFGNNTSQPKKAFHFESGTYTFGWLWATTDRTFNRCWPKLAGISSGLEDRMFFVVSPKEPKPTAPYSDPILAEGAARTRQLIDKAVAQATFNFESPEWFAKKVSGMDPRSMDLIQKLSLYFCVDMGGTVIDDEHVDRAMALVQYRNQAAEFLAPIEADGDGGRVQKEIIRELRQNRGKMRYRDLCNAMEYTRIELFKWNRLFHGLVNEGLIFEFPEQITPGKRATRMVGLAKLED